MKPLPDRALAALIHAVTDPDRQQSLVEAGVARRIMGAKLSRADRAALVGYFLDDALLVRALSKVGAGDPTGFAQNLAAHIRGGYE